MGDKLGHDNIMIFLILILFVNCEKKFSSNHLAREASPKYSIAKVDTVMLLDLDSKEFCNIIIVSNYSTKEIKFYLHVQKQVKDSIIVPNTYNVLTMDIINNSFLVLDIPLKAGMGHRYSELYIFSCAGNQIRKSLEISSKDKYNMDFEEDRIKYKLIDTISWSLSNGKFEASRYFYEIDDSKEEKFEEKMSATFDFSNYIFFSHRINLFNAKLDSSDIFISGNYAVIEKSNDLRVFYAGDWYIYDIDNNSLILPNPFP